MFVELPLTLQDKESVCGSVGESAPSPNLPSVPSLCLHVNIDIDKYCQVSPSVLVSRKPWNETTILVLVYSCHDYCWGCLG